jgi:hypothetical protein
MQLSQQNRMLHKVAARLAAATLRAGTAFHFDVSNCLGDTQLMEASGK